RRLPRSLGGRPREPARLVGGRRTGCSFDDQTTRRSSMNTRSDEGYGSALFGAAALLMGLLVAVLGFAVVMMWLDARNNDKQKAPAATTTMPGMGDNGSLTSYAGAAPANAYALAMARKPYPAELPAAPAGRVADVHLVLTDLTVQIAPGIRYAAWAWAGGAPGPVIHVRQGQLLKITLTNEGAIPHSVDFHAARIAPNVAFG